MEGSNGIMISVRSLSLITFPSPLEDMEGSNGVYENLKFFIDFVSVPSRGYGGF